MSGTVLIPERVLVVPVCMLIVTMEEAGRKREGPQGLPLETVFALPPRTEAGPASVVMGPSQGYVENAWGGRVVVGRKGDVLATCPTGRLT